MSKNIAIIESIGFSGTKRLADTLNRAVGADVSHGTSNFQSKEPGFFHNIKAEEFVEQLLTSSRDNDNVFAVHTLFPPNIMADLCGKNVIRYIGLFRNPKDHINSCFNWIIKKILIDRAINPVDYSIQKSIAEELTRHNISAHFQNVFYAWAAERVISYQAALWEKCHVRLRIEDVQEAPNLIQEILGIDDYRPMIKFFKNHDVNSHTKRMDALKIPAPDSEIIMDIGSVVIFGERVRFSDLNKVFGYGT